MRAILVTALMVTLALAGCTSNGGANAPIDTAPSAEKGVILGLFVDDRFRPLHVAEDGINGFILIQETGQELHSNVDGEFESLPLDPGTYTLRAAADGHEISPITVQVRANEFTDASIIARRVVSTEDLLVQQEFAVFIPCMMGAVVTPIGACALMDLSGDTTRYVFRMNITAYKDAHFMINELILNKDAGSLRDGTYMMQMEGPNPDGGVSSYNFVSKFIQDGRYDKTIVEKGFADPELQQDALLTHGTWEDEMDWVGWRFWGQGLLRKDLNEAGVPAPYGVGPQVAMKAKVLTTLLFHEDREIAEESCWFCSAE